MNAFLSWMNVEKGIFFATALWLAATGVGFQATPIAEEWGPPRTVDSVPERRPVSFEAPPPIEGFLAGARNPFTEVAGKTAFRPRRLPTWRPPQRATPKAPVRRPTPPAKRPPPPPRPKPPTPSAEKVTEEAAAKPKPYDLPVRWAGRIKVGRKDGRTIFVAKEDGRYIIVKEGQELPELGVRVVSATKSVVIVENEKGQRFRLTDLLRAKAEEE